MVKSRPAAVSSGPIPRAARCGSYTLLRGHPTAEAPLNAPHAEARYTRPDLRPTGTLGETLRRRALMVPLLLFFATGVLGALPLWLLLTFLFDLAREGLRSRRLATSRALLFLALFLVSDLMGFFGGLWALRLLLTERGRQRWLAENHALAWAWADRMFRGTLRVFSMRKEVEGEEVLAAGGPFLFFVRHASGGDVVVPITFAGQHHGLGLRIVIKRELLYDPGIDLVCSRLPCVFVKRGAQDPAGEVEEVCKLATDIGRDECLAIFPEGTRFGGHKREKLLERLAEKGDTLTLERARALRRTLPPRPGGPVALIERNPNLDVVFCAHVGYEGAADWGEVWRGALAHRDLKIRFWRVPAAEIPREHAEAERWLFEQWLAMDRWIEQNG